MRLGQQGAHHARRGAGIHQIIQKQPAFAIARCLGQLHYFGFALGFLLISQDGNGFDQPAIQFARHHGGRDQPAAGDGHHAAPGAAFKQPPSQSLRIPMQLVPGNRVIFLRHQNILPPFGTR